MTFVLIFSNLVISLLRKRNSGSDSYSGVYRGYRDLCYHRSTDHARRSCLRWMRLWACLSPLIVVNCIIFGRAEAFAFKNKPPASQRR